MKFHFSIAAWGDAFLRVLTEVHLPSLLAPGNLPAFLERYPLEYRLYTTPEDAEKLDTLKGFQDFRRAVPTRVFPVPGLDFSDVHYSHRVFNDLMRRAMRDAVAEEAYLFMNNPDTCWGDGSFRHVADLIAAGWRGILNTAIRADSHRFMATVRERFALDANGALAIPNRQLVKLGWDTMHPYQTSTVWGRGNTSLMPSPIITPVEGEGFILNMAHMGSLCVISDSLCQDFEQTTDGDYINRIFADYSDIHVIESSEDVCVMELSDPARYMNNVVPGVPINEQHVAEYLFATASWAAHSLKNFRRRVRYHWCEPDPPSWRRAEAEVDERVEAILNRRQLLAWSAALKGEESCQGFVRLLESLLRDPERFRRTDRCRPRAFLVPDLHQLRESLHALAKPRRAEDADLESFLRALILDLPEAGADGGELVADAWNGRRFSLTPARQGEPRSIEAVDGVKVRKRIDLEDGVVLLLDAGLTLPVPVQPRNGRQRGPRAPARRVAASPFQRDLVVGALWNTALAAGETTPLARFLARFALRPGYGKRLLYFLWKTHGTATAIRVLATLAPALASPRRAVVSRARLREAPEWRRALHVLDNELAGRRWDEVDAWTWGETAKALRARIIRTDVAVPAGQDDLDALLTACYLATSASAGDLARNSEIYYEMGLTLHAQKLYSEGMACFSVCAFLSPGFVPPLDMMSINEARVLDRRTLVQKLVADV